MVPYLRVDAVVGSEPALVRVHGELDLHSCPEIIAALAPLASRHVQLDLGPLTFIDSSGIATLLALREAGVRAGGSLRVIHCSSAVERTLDLVGCRQLLTSP